MNQDAADAFIAWFRQEEKALSEKHQSMLSIIEENQRPQEAAHIFQTLEKEIAPRLSDIDDGLRFELGPGEKKQQGFIISAGGLERHIPAVKYLASALQDLEHWDVIAFKPARPLTAETVQVYMFHDGERRISPADILVSLKPGLTRIAASFYFDAYDEEDYSSWAQVGFNFLDFSLGEYAVIGCIGDLTFQSRVEAPDDAVPLTELYDSFQRKRDEVIACYNEIESLATDERLQKQITAVEHYVSQVQDDSEGLEHADDVFLVFSLWGKEAASEAFLQGLSKDVALEVSKKMSVHGEGYDHIITLSVPRENFSAAEILGKLLSMADTILYPVDLSIQEAPEPSLAHFAAMSMIDQGQFEDAIRFLKMTIRLLGSNDDGTLQLLLGHAYLNSKQFERAHETYAKALDSVTDEAMRGEILSNNGNALQQLGKLEDALLCFEEAASLDDSMYTRNYNLGQAYALLGDIEKACSYLGKALDQNPEIRPLMKSDTDLDSIRSTEQFSMMLEHHGKQESLKDSLVKGLKSFFSSESDS